MLADRDNKFRPLFPWARNRLNEVTDGVAEVTPDAVHELAMFIGQKHSDVASFLARFIPEDLPKNHEPAAEVTDCKWSGGPGGISPRAPTDPCVTVSRYTASVVLVIWRAGFTQVQLSGSRSVVAVVWRSR